MHDARGRGAATRRRIIAAATNLFAERGFRGATVADIARAVDLSEGAIYRHFDSKEELLMQCITPAFEGASQSMDLQMSGDAQPEDMVRGYVELGLQIFEEHYEAFKIIFAEMPHSPVLAQRCLDALGTHLKKNQHLYDTLYERTESHRPRGRNWFLIAISQDLALWAVYNLCRLLEEKDLSIPDPMLEIAEGDLARDFANFLLHGIAGVPPETQKDRGET